MGEEEKHVSETVRRKEQKPVGEPEGCGTEDSAIRVMAVSLLEKGSCFPCKKSTWGQVFATGQRVALSVGPFKKCKQRKQRSLAFISSILVMWEMSPIIYALFGPGLRKQCILCPKMAANGHSGLSGKLQSPGFTPQSSTLEGAFTHRGEHIHQAVSTDTNAGTFCKPLRQPSHLQ